MKRLFVIVALLGLIAACTSNPYKNSDSLQSVILTTCQVGQVGTHIAAKMWVDPQIAQEARQSVHDIALKMKDPLLGVCTSGKALEQANATVATGTTTQAQLQIAIDNAQKALDTVTKPSKPGEKSLLEQLGDATTKGVSP